VVVAAVEKQVHWWDLRSAAEQRFVGHKEAVRRVALSPDGQLLVSVGDDATVRLWQVATGAARVLFGHEGIVLALAFSPDGRSFATAGLGGAVRQWQAELRVDVPRDPVALRRWLAEATTGVLSEDGECATASIRPQTGGP
jgi:WD40 repeat protein